MLYALKFALTILAVELASRLPAAGELMLWVMVTALFL
jgi:hypothetical protein